MRKKNYETDKSGEIKQMKSKIFEFGGGEGVLESECAYVCGGKSVFRRCVSLCEICLYTPCFWGEIFADKQ